MLWKSLRKTYSQNSRYSIIPVCQLLRTLFHDRKYIRVFDPKDCSNKAEPIIA